MIRAILYDSKSGEMVSGDERLIEDWKGNPDKLIWVDLFEVPPEEERSLLENDFSLHPLAVQDATRDRHPPKLERFDDYLFLIFKGLHPDSNLEEFKAIQICIFLGSRFLVTRHTGLSPSIDWVWDRVSEAPRIFELGTSGLCLQLMDRIVRRFMPILLSLEVRLDEIEDELFEQPRDALMGELSGYKANLKRMRRFFIYHEQMLSQIRANPAPYFGKHQSHELNDVYEQLERSMSLAGLYHEIATDLIDGYLALASHRLNKVMQVLTIFTVIFVPLGFLAGMYGMNFEYIPELKFKYAYFILLGVMATIVCVQLILFRKRKWL
ncbi:MAG: magnesium/cobalt transporter CorA [Gammaproteobacteria bacterium]|nr:magnesium/cobalt transporter CorA [Gammaproteobacteria bacterium]